MLIDTSILVDVARGRADALTFLGGLSADPLLSAVTLAELHAGMRSQREERDIARLISRWRVVRIEADIARRGGMFRRLYGVSHGVGLLDALIAACAEAEDAPLATRNPRHFPMLDRVITPY